MNKCNLPIIGFAEGSWTGKLERRLNSGETIIESGRQVNKHMEGEAKTIESKYANTLLQWKPINERILYIRLNVTHIELSIIAVFAPTVHAYEMDK